MKLAAMVLVLALVAACQAGGGDDYPIGPGAGNVIGGNGSGGGGGSSDAGIGDGGDAGDGDAGVPISGRVCILTDLRKLTVCDTRTSTDASVLTVSIGNRSVHPSKTGEFTIAAPLGTFTWRVTGNVFITSLMQLESQVLIPVVTEDLYNNLLSTNSVVLAPELQGSIVLRVVSGVTAVAAVNATSDPVANNLAFYDRGSLLDWDNGNTGTGTAGIVWLPGIQMPATPTTVTVSLRPQGSTVAVTTQVVVEDHAITFATKDLQ
jgi:hypothetical protein